MLFNDFCGREWNCNTSIHGGLKHNKLTAGATNYNELPFLNDRTHSKFYLDWVHSLYMFCARNPHYHENNT